MQLCRWSTGRGPVERSRRARVDISFTQTQKMEAILKAEATVLPPQSASNAGIDCSTCFSTWVINEGRGWDVMINSIWGFLRLPAGWLGACCGARGQTKDLYLHISHHLTQLLQQSVWLAAIFRHDSCLKGLSNIVSSKCGGSLRRVSAQYDVNNYRHGHSAQQRD